MMSLLGNDKLKQGDYVTAVTLYTRAIELAPSNAPYYANRYMIL